MDYKFLKQLVKQGEGQTIEFKKKAADPIKIMKEVVAFANREGGYLIVGVTDNGRIDGFIDIEGEKFVLEKAIREHVSVDIDYIIHEVSISSTHQVLVFEIPPSDKKPVFLWYNLKRKTGRAYIRVVDKSIQMSRLIRRLLKEKSKNQINTLEYGANERLVLQMLDKTKQITLNQFIKVSKLEENQAMDVLINMCLTNVIVPMPMDPEDRFVMNVVN
ncbi:helix-turn-helix domain-containing protein [Flammeovirga sp. EKP202]|uniref:AlbA family DNA-binding domain-containing protein n=1 Tax=Flammeovirga sp. EKP202 TaxID=2770592 RepID=UPI00165F683D|nr:ATP-binding protein [Flammeovirga sp. EKP202]MBD0405253.1 ATP-binding protein [Flammeovirga sp. EKP202]